MGIFLAVLTGALTVAGNYYAKAWSVEPRAVTFALCMVFYTAGGAVFPFSLRHETLVVMEIVSSLAIVLITIAVGMLAFGERVSGAQAAGIVLACASVVLLNLPART